MAKLLTRTPNTLPFGVYRIDQLPVGEYVRQPGKTKVYRREKFDAFNRRYPLTDMDDVNRDVLKRGSVLVEAGFTY